MLKRSFVFYAILGIILLRMDFGVIHYQRSSYLKSLYQIGFIRSICQGDRQGNDPLAGIVYFDYARRVDPHDVSAWKNLVKSYLAYNDPEKARETLRDALQITPKTSAEYSSLQDLDDHLKMRLPLQ